MPDDDIEDTKTGSVPVDVPPPPPMEEEMPTSITTSPTSAIEQALEDGPTGVTRSPVDDLGARKPTTPSSDKSLDMPAIGKAIPDVIPVPERSPADDEGPTSISRVPLDDEPPTGRTALSEPPEDGPTGITKVDLPPPDEVPTGKTARPAGVVPPGLLRTLPSAVVVAPADVEEDSVVTRQQPLPQDDDDSIATIQPLSGKTANGAPKPLTAPLPPPKPLAAPLAPPKPASITQKAGSPVTTVAKPGVAKNAASDVYDVDDDRTERRDLPVDEINRAIARAKQEPVAISEIPDESPTARRADLAITPRAGVKSARPDDLEEDPPELSTETDIGPIVRRALADSPVRPPFASDADQVATEPRIESEQPKRVPRTTNLMHTQPLPEPRSPAAPPVAAAPPPAQKSTLPPPPRPPQSPEMGTDSYTFQGGAGALQAVIPVTTGAGRVAQPPQPTPSSTPSGGLILDTSGAPSTQSMNVQPLPPYPSAGQQPIAIQQHPGPMQALAAMPTQPATFPPGMPPGFAGNSSSMPAAPPSGRISLGPTFPGAGAAGGQSQLNGMGGGPALESGLYELEPREEPRWIVLVLGVLAICILIPTVLYFVLHARADDAPPEETPPAVKAVVTVQTAQPRDIGKRGR